MTIAVKGFLGQVEPMAPAQTTVRRLEDGKLIVKLPRFGYITEPLPFSPDGRFLVIFSVENEVALLGAGRQFEVKAHSDSQNEAKLRGAGCEMQKQNALTPHLSLLITGF